MLHTVHLDLVAAKRGIDDLSKELPGIQDTARNVTTIIEGLPRIANGIIDIHKILPDLAGNVTTVHGRLTDVSLKVTALHDVLPVIQDALQHLSVGKFR